MVSNQSTQVNDVEQGHTDWMYDNLPADRVAEVKQKYEGTQYRQVPAIGLDFLWMNTTAAALRRRQGAPGGQLRDQPGDDRTALRRRTRADPADHPPGVPGYEKLDLYPFDMAKAKALLREANPSDLNITLWTDSLNEESGESFEALLDEIGFDAKLKVVNADNYFTVIGDEKTPDLDIGWASFAADYPNPNAFFEPLLSGASILPTNNTNLSRIDVPSLTAKIEKLASEPLGPQQEKEYAALDRAYMEVAPMAPYGAQTASLFVSSAINFGDVIWNPIFSGDLTSFQFK